jgi:hypothetical protein
LIRLATIEEPVIGEPGKVFSTAPEVAIGEDGRTYYIKGRNNSTAFSEVVGCRLAAAAGLLVPVASVCSLDGDVYAGVERVPRAQLNIRPWLRELKRINNPADLFSVIGVDTWLANDDRNMGNLVGSSLGEGRIDVFMIDFEKSKTLAANPFIGAGSVDPKRLWPRDELGKILLGIRPKRCPELVLERISAVSREQISDIVLPIAAELPFVAWHDSSIEVLARRAQNIARLVEAVWETN